MASVDQPFSTENDDQSGNSGTSANSNIGQAPQLSNGGGGTTTNAGAGTSGGGFQGKGVAAPTQSGAYPNLQQYMTANQNWTNSQGQTLGGSVASNLNQQGNQVQQATSNAQNAFQNQGNTWQQNTTSAANAFNQGLSNPYGFTQNNPQATQDASQALNASYQGPQSLEAANPSLQQQTQNYANTAQETQTEGGRFNLLSQMFGNNNYSQGQQTLDNSLLQTNPQNMQQMQGAFQQATQQQQNLANAQNASQQQVQNWSNFGNQTAQQAAQNLNAAVGNENQNIQNEYTTAQQNQASDLATIQAALNSGTISQQQATELGLGPIANTYGLNLGNYAQDQALTAQNTATAQDYNTIAALAQLGATDTSALTPGSSTVLQTYANQPGTLYNSTNDIGFNNTAYTNALNQQKDQYATALTLGDNPLLAADVYAGGPVFNYQDSSGPLSSSTAWYAPYIQGFGPNGTVQGITPDNAMQILGTQAQLNAVEAETAAAGNHTGGPMTLGQADSALQQIYNINQQYGGGLNVGTPGGQLPSSTVNTAINLPNIASMMSGMSGMA